MAQFEAPAQAVMDAAPAMTSVSGYVYFVLLSFPYFLGVALALIGVTIWKKMKVAEDNTMYSVKRQYRVAMLGGLASGIWTTYAFQELGSFLIGIPSLTVKSCVTTGILVSLSNPFIYDYIRVRGSTTNKKWLRALARVLTVKPKTPKGEIKEAGEITQTIFQNEDVTDQRD